MKIHKHAVWISVLPNKDNFLIDYYLLHILLKWYIWVQIQ